MRLVLRRDHDFPERAGTRGSTFGVMDLHQLGRNAYGVSEVEHTFYDTMPRVWQVLGKTVALGRWLQEGEWDWGDT